MRNFLSGFRELHRLAPDARVIEINGAIGVMRRQVRAWLDETP